MEALLSRHAGYPSATPFVPMSKFLHDLRPAEQSLPGTVLHGCYWIPQEKAEDLKQLLEPLPFRTVGVAKPLRLWHAHPTKPLIGVPKFFGLSSQGLPETDKRELGVSVSLDLDPSIVLKDIQCQGVSAYVESMIKWGGGFFVADCGFGKTFVMAAVLAKLGRKAMIVAPNLTLLAQIHSELGKCLHQPILGILQGAPNDKKLLALEKSTVIVASLCTLAQFSYPPSFWKTVGTVLFDEAHLMCAKSLCAILPHIPARYLGGFSATPTRGDKLDFVLYWLLGPTAFVYQRTPEITGKIGTVIIQKTAGVSLATPFSFSSNVFPALMSSIAQHDERNQFIVNLTLDLCKSRSKILLLTAFREHAEYFQHQLSLQGISCLLLLGGKKRKREDPEIDAKCTVATYKLLEMGYDDKFLDTLVLCTPKSTIQQTVGRVEREAPGKAVPLVIDIVDINPLLQGMWKKRLKFYTSRGFTIQGKNTVENIQ
jgi:superfamily II DNA or RNA helicase